MSQPVPCEHGDNALELCRVFSVEVEPVLEALTFPNFDLQGNVRAVSRYALLTNITRPLWPDVREPFSPAFADQCLRIAERGPNPLSSLNVEVPSALHNGPVGLVKAINRESLRSSQMETSNVSQLPADCLVITAIETFYTQIQNLTNKTPLSNSSTSQAHGIIAVLDRAGRLLFTFTWLHALALLAPSTLTSFPVADLKPRFPLHQERKFDDSFKSSIRETIENQKELEQRCQIAAKLMSLTLREFHLILTSASTAEKFNGESPDLPYWWSAYILPEGKVDQKVGVSKKEGDTCAQERPPLPTHFLRNAGVSNICIVDSKLRMVGGLNLSSLFQTLCDFGTDEEGESRYQKMLTKKAKSEQHLQETEDEPLPVENQKQPEKSKVLGSSDALSQSDKLTASGIAHNEVITSTEKPKSRLADDDAWEAEMAELHRSSMVLNALHSRMSAVLSIGEKPSDNAFEHKQDGEGEFWETDEDYDDPEVAYAKFLSEAEVALADDDNALRDKEQEEQERKWD